MMALPSSIRTGLLKQLVVAAGAATVLLLLALLIAVILVWTLAPPSPLLPTSASITAIEIVTPEKGDTSYNGAFLERPLFWRERRPFVAEASVQDESPAPGPDPFVKVKLVGIFAADADSGVILDIDGKRKRLLMNGKVDGWKLTRILPDTVTFTYYSSDNGAPIDRPLKLEYAMVGLSGSKAEEKDVKVEPQGSDE